MRRVLFFTVSTHRPKCLDHVVVEDESHLRRLLSSAPFSTTTAAERISASTRNTPERRPTAETSVGPIIVMPEVGGLHHRHERHAAYSAPS